MFEHELISNPFGFDIGYSDIDIQQKLNNTNTYKLQKKYGLTYRDLDKYITETLARFGRNSTIENLESYIKTMGHAVIEESQEETYNQKEIQFSPTVKLPSLEYCQSYWSTSQNNVVVPSKHINSMKKPPISTLIGVSAMSGKEGVNTIDGTGKGARIMSIKRINKLYKNLIETRQLKPRTIESHIRKLLKLKTKEFEFVTLETPKGKEEQYYKLDYSDGFVLIDLRIMHYMFTCYSDNIIQAYIVFLWTCRDGWAQLTREQMAEHLGLTQHSDKQAKIIMDKLVLDGFIEQKSQYQGIQIIDKSTGIPKTITMPYYEYRVVTLDEIENEEYNKAL